MPRETIILDLVTGDPQGFRIASFSQSWAGKAFAAPRTELKNLLGRAEMNSAGVYVLAAREPEPDQSQPLAYVGMGKSIRKRLQNRKEEFWNQAVIFVGIGGNLHEAHARFLEGRLIEEAKDVGRFNITNDQSSGSPLPEHEIAGMELFLEKMRILLPVLGCDILVRASQTSQKQILTCKIKGLVAHGHRTSRGFVVLKGSNAILDVRPAAKEHGEWVIHLRNKLLGTGALTRDGDRYAFTKDIEFTSPSAAAAVIRGGNANGLTEWKSAQGKQLKDLDAEDL